MTREQMIAWLMLEGYMLSSDRGDVVWCVSRDPTEEWELIKRSRSDRWDLYAAEDRTGFKLAGVTPESWTKLPAERLRQLYVAISNKVP